MRMVPPLRGVWASAVTESATAKPATIAIFFNIVFSPTVQRYPDQRFDHSQHAERKALVSGPMATGAEQPSQAVAPVPEGGPPPGPAPSVEAVILASSPSGYFAAGSGQMAFARGDGIPDRFRDRDRTMAFLVGVEPHDLAGHQRVAAVAQNGMVQRRV